MSFNNRDKSFINNIFTNVSNNYDIMNDFMSFGLHRIWKDKMISNIINRNGMVLDVATGTGDIGLSVAQRFNNLKVVLYDINYNMMTVCRKKAIDKNILNLNYSCGDADSLPFSDNAFDYYLISFGIRNVCNRKKALEEAYRVLNFGGKFICLEFSPSKNFLNSMFRRLYDFYSSNIIPKLGQLIAKNKEAYEYLVESIRLFPASNDFINELEEVGFDRVSGYSMSCGIVNIHIGWKTMM